ncbi:response regulator [Roseospira marina]|uniref:Response regulator n=1 Tax=Roseospira marina TaxID=140057 RepID=A0A5M6IGL9_9PROT|nr:response regulator [Roseospira marina]KAA5607037.1 response regulator [Roseospira marina]MBB4312776.1 CheY-like chemotaxis protein [Roseospira marina]MBB5086451.1 CheY-like chemotaxis protein [Roseospira marina]
MDERKAAGAGGDTADSVLAEMRREFLDELADGARDLTLAIDAARHDPGTVPEVVRLGQRFGLTIRSRSETLGLSPLTAIGLRLGDYLGEVRNVPAGLVLDDLERFVELALDIGEGRIPVDAEQGPLVRTLPAKRGFAPAEVEVRDIEVVLVMEPGTQTHFVERELQQCGYRTVQVSSTFEALPLIVRTKPDMVVVSAVMPGLSGIDLTIGLTAMPETRNVAVALITSLDPSSDALSLLPKRVPIIKKGPSFGDDLFNALDNLFLI